MEVFDEVPPAIDMKVAGDSLLSVQLRKDHRRSSAFVQFVWQLVSVEGPAAQKHGEFDVLDQRSYPKEVMAWTRDQSEPD